MDAARFLHAQEAVFAQVQAELQAGQKQTHWMWFIFPQLAGLGHSAMAQRFALEDADAARAYLRHPILGRRLHVCTDLVAAHVGRSAHDIFGEVDALKFRSSMTLFDFVAASEHGCFRKCLEIFFGGAGDPASLRQLREA